MNNKIKILFLIPTLDGGGAEKVLVNLVNNLDYNKFDITVMTVCNKGINIKYINKNIKYKYFFNFNFPKWSIIFKLFSTSLIHNFFIKNKYDIEIAYLHGPCSRIISGCKNKDTKLITFIHGLKTTKKQVSVGFRNFNEAKMCYSKFNKIFCVSLYIKECFDKLLDLNTQVLYNVNESDSIIDLSKEKINIKYNKDEFNIVSVGSVKSVKGYYRLAKIQKRLIDNGYNTHIYICGEGNQKKEILDYLKDNNIDNTWSFLGYTENPYKYVSKADLFVCSSYSEGLSTAVTESLYVGTPVISTFVSGVKELLGENNEFGLVVDNNEKSLYEGIKYLIDNPNILLKYKEQSKIRGEFFSKDKIIKQYEDLFMKIVN